MKQIIYSMLFLALAMAGQSAFAADRVVQAEYNSSTREVQLLIEDTKESGQACNYHVTKMTYYKDARLLSLHLGEEPCFLQVIGKKKASFVWSVPRSLHQESFCLRVDGKSLARITFDGSRAVVSESCSK